MTTTIAENANRDVYLDASSNIAFVSDAGAVGQLCKSRIEAQRGEMKYAANLGMPTRATAWDAYNPKQFEAAARSIISGTDGVTAITSFAITRSGNDLNYSAVIQTIYGTTTVYSQ